MLKELLKALFCINLIRGVAEYDSVTVERKANLVRWHIRYNFFWARAEPGSGSPRQMRRANIALVV